MRIRILESAVADLAAGRDFYDRQEIGVGDYFQNCLFSDVESLVLYAGIHRQVFGFHRLLSKRFPYAILLSYSGRHRLGVSYSRLQERPSTAS